MKFDFMASWEQNQDLNWGEMLQVARAAEQAAVEKAREIRKQHKAIEDEFHDVEQTQGSFNRTV